MTCFYEAINGIKLLNYYLSFKPYTIIGIPIFSTFFQTKRMLSRVEEVLNSVKIIIIIF